MIKIILFLLLFFVFVLYSLLTYTTGTKSGELVMNENAVRGKSHFQKYNCGACHQLYGLGGYLGPELTTIISQPGKGEVYAKSLLQSGSQRMPNFHLQENEIDELIKYFKYVDSSAITYKVKKQ